MRTRASNKNLGLVVGVDDSPAAKVALNWAARDAEMRRIPLTVVHTVALEVAAWLELPAPPGLARWQKDQGRRLLDDAIAVVAESCRHGG
ncbi:MAG: universal stress protein, partial [Mycobacteriaceae bacterium]|nr:universal stress protein [Mycobacteriaceae bacterium]